MSVTNQQNAATVSTFTLRWARQPTQNLAAKIGAATLKKTPTFYVTVETSEAHFYAVDSFSIFKCTRAQTHTNTSALNHNFKTK